MLMNIPIMAIVTILIALVFEFINGFHDTANAVATSVSTKSLEPLQAIAISAIFNLVGAMSGTAVAITIAKGFADPAFATDYVILSALIAAVIWNLITWAFGIPSSSSHALIGGLVGAIAFNSGFSHINYISVIHKVIIPMVLSPLIGFAVAMVIAVSLGKLLRNNQEPRKTNNFIRELQVLSTAFLSFSHGANDAQKTMGIITLTLFNYKLLDKCQVPFWVVLICAFCMALGTISGGLRIIKTLSSRVAKLKPVSGFAAEVTSATVLFFGARLGIPLSTTHAVSGSIMGAGNSEKSGINWKVVQGIVISWCLTLPVCALIAGLILHLIKLFM